jgi:hypothetical protein
VRRDHDLFADARLQVPVGVSLFEDAGPGGVANVTVEHNDSQQVQGLSL